MPAARSILSVVRLMLEAGLPHGEILRTLNACISALPPLERHPIDRAPAIVVAPTPADFAEAAQNSEDSGDSARLALSPALIAETSGL